MPSVLARIVATMGRLCCALVALLGIAAGAAACDWRVLMGPAFVGVLWPAALAIGGGLLLQALVGIVRIFHGAEPGQSHDPARRIAAVLAPHGRLVLAVLALLGGGAGIASFVIGGEGGAASCRAAALLFFFLLARARHLAWFAGRRDVGADGTDGVVRFSSARFPVAAALTVGILLAVVFAGLSFCCQSPVALRAVLLVGLVSVLGWFALALPVRYVTVGADGILVSAWRRSFVPFGEDTIVQVQPARIDVHDARLRRRMNPLFYPPMAVEDRDALRHRLKARVDPHVPADAALVASAVTLEALATGSLAPDAEGTRYRVAEVPRETLWRIVETPTLPSRVRLRAAELAITEPNENDGDRLLALAARTADPDTADTLARLGRLARR